MNYLILNNVTNISSSTSFDFLDTPILLRKTTSYNFRVFYSDMKNQSGSLISMSEIEEIKNYNDFSWILQVNGKIFKNFIIQSISFESGNLNKHSIVNFSILIYELGENIQEVNFYEIYKNAVSQLSPTILDSISDSMQVSVLSGSKRIDRKLSIKLNNNLRFDNDSIIKIAEEFAVSILSYNDPVFQDFNLNNFQTKKSQSIDIENNLFEFSIGLDLFDSINQGEYTSKISEKYAKTRDGIEEVSLVGEVNFFDQNANLKNKIMDIINYHWDILKNKNNKLSLIRIDHTINDFVKKANFGFVATTDNQLNEDEGFYISKYSYNENVNGSLIYVEGGRIESVDKTNKTEAFKKVKEQIPTPSSDFELEKSNVKYNKHNCWVEYEYIYQQNFTILQDDEGAKLKKQIYVSEAADQKKYEFERTLNGLIRVDTKKQIPISRTFSIKLEGYSENIVELAEAEARKILENKLLIQMSGAWDVISKIYILEGEFYDV